MIVTVIFCDRHVTICDQLWCDRSLQSDTRDKLIGHCDVTWPWCDILWRDQRPGPSHSPLHTRPECWNLQSTSEGWRRDAPPCIWMGMNTIFEKLEKNQEWMYEAEILFTSRYNPRLNVKKISASYVHFWFFTIFQKLRLFPFKYMVKRRVLSLRSSTEDFSIPALCEVGRGHPWYHVPTKVNQNNN